MDREVWAARCILIQQVDSLLAWQCLCNGRARPGVCLLNDTASSSCLPLFIHNPLVSGREARTLGTHVCTCTLTLNMQARMKQETTSTAEEVSLGRETMHRDERGQTSVARSCLLLPCVPSLSTPSPLPSKAHPPVHHQSLPPPPSVCVYVLCFPAPCVPDHCVRAPSPTPPPPPPRQKNPPPPPPPPPPPSVCVFVLCFPPPCVPRHFVRSPPPPPPPPG